MKNLKPYIKMAKDNPKVSAGVIVGLIVLIWIL
jgi:hypothetical protein